MTTLPHSRRRLVVRLAALGALATLGAAAPPRATVRRPAVQEPAVQEPAVQEPAVQEPAVQEPAVQEPVRPDSARGAAVAVPWGVGERLEYDVKLGVFHVGDAVLDLPEITEVRNRPVYHTVFRINGAALFYHVKDTYESWIDTATLSSLRFYQTQLERGKSRNKRYEIYPERQTYQDGEKPEERSVSEPLDDGSFFYFVRTLPLRTGDVYEFNRYFKADRNPVRIRVLRRERVSVPAGTFNAVVVQPTFKTKGYFSEGGRAEVWISDDADRTVVRVQAALPVGSLTMQLRSRRVGRRPT